MKSSDKLINDFAQVCRQTGGEFKETLGTRHCIYPDMDGKLFNLRLSTLSSHIQGEIGLSNVTMFDVKKVENRDDRFMAISEKGEILHVRPKIGVITFHGDVKGAIG